MFLIVPYSTPTTFKKTPYVSYMVIMVCIVVFYFQYQNKKELAVDADVFCEKILQKEFAGNVDSLDKMRTDKFLCQLMIKRLEQRPDLSTLDVLKEYFWFNDHTSQQLNTMSVYIDSHYREYASQYTRYLNSRLMYYPLSPEFIKIFSSSLAHADIWHLIGNIIFFLAFAPAIELLLARAWLFITIIAATMIATMLSYSLSVYLGGEALPALGLSGVVMAMIGLYAALMPTEKIKVFVWLLLYMRHLMIPAWILALWYIGFDLLDLILGTGNPAINLIAHVAGGLCGFLLGFFVIKKYFIKPGSI